MINSLEKINNILLEFEKELQQYSYKLLIINKKEKVAIIEDSLVLYFGFLTNFEDWYGKCNTNFKEKEEYILKIEELTPNTIGFKFNTNTFISK